MKRLLITLQLTMLFFPAKSQHTLFCKTYGQWVNAPYSSFYIDSIEQDYSGCTVTPAIHVVVIDSLSCAPWGTSFNGNNINHQFGNINNNGACRTRVEYFFAFDQNDSVQLNSLNNMLNDSIPEGNSVLIYTWQYVNYDNWITFAPSLFSTFQNLGMSNVGLIDSIPFIFYVKKGYQATSLEVYGANITDSIQLTANLFCGPTGIENELSNNSDLHVFPNPFQNKAMIQFNNLTNDNCILMLFDTFGKCVRTISGIHSDKVEIEKNDLKSGLYIVQIKTDKQIISIGKIAVE